MYESIIVNAKEDTTSNTLGHTRARKLVAYLIVCIRTRDLCLGNELLGCVVGERLAIGRDGPI